MKHFVRLCCVFLLSSLLLISVLSLAAGAEPSSFDLRYGTGDDRDTVLRAADLFALLYPDEAALAAAEIAYLNGDPSLSLRYRSDIPDSIVDTVYDGDAGTLTVTVPAYSYIAQNGKTVVWVPETVSMDEDAPIPLTFDGENYIAVYRNLWYSEEFDLTVRFIWSDTLPVEAADALLTLPGAVAAAALEQILSYASAKEIYDAQKAAYEDYVAAKTTYDAQKAAYDAYLAAKTVYDEYNAYLAAKAEYDAKVTAYEQNRARQEAYEQALTAYYAYEAQCQQNAALYDRYEAYLDTIERIDFCLAILESMFLSDSHGWQFYGSLVGGTVDSVLEKRTELKSLRVSESDIDNANEATEALRELMRGYESLRNETYSSAWEKTVALFAYYAEHYSDLRTQTAKLFDSINAIYSSGTVQTVMENNPTTKDKVPHFRQFLAQLYVLKSCLNDIGTLDLAWTLPYDSEPLSSLVEEPLLLTDGNRADPTGIEIPAEEITFDVSLPEPVEKPEKDFIELEDPRIWGEPEPIADPGAEPAAVADPGEEPAFAEPPSAEPTEPTLSDAERALAEALASGILPNRSPRGVAPSFTCVREVKAHRSIRNRKTVTFYDWEGTPVGNVREVDYGEEITDPPTLLRDEDGAYSYTFLGWIPYGSNDESPMSLAEITSNLSLSPLFSRRAKTYEVTWRVAGRTEVQFYGYEEMPICPIDTDRAGSASTVYTFVGWDREIEPVTAPAIYTACYESATAVYTVTWDLGDRTLSERLPYGATPAYPGQPEREPDGSLYEFRGWDTPVGRVMGDATYRAVWRTTPLVANAASEACRAEYTETTLIVYPEDDMIDLSVVSRYARSEGKTLLLRRDALELSLTPSDLDRLSGDFCTKIEWIVEPTDTEEGALFRILCRNSLGQERETNLSFAVTARYPASEGLYTMAYRVDGSENLIGIGVTRYAGGRTVFSVKQGESVICRPEYLLQYTDESDRCNPTLLPTHAAKGEEVSLATDCAYGYEVSGATLVYASGRTEIVGANFQMPAERVRVLLNVTQIAYHITFVSDGNILSEQDRLFGEEIVVPEDPAKSDGNGYRYLFAGWSPIVTRRATGEDRNPIYTAIFSETPIADDPIPVGRWAFFRSPLFIACVAGFLLLAVGIVLFLLRKKIFRKRDLSAGQIDAPSANGAKKLPTGKSTKKDPAAKRNKV